MRIRTFNFELGLRMFLCLHRYQDYAYTVFSTFGAFWFPLTVIIVVYARIFAFARRRVLRRTCDAAKVSQTTVPVCVRRSTVVGGREAETTHTNTLALPTLSSFDRPSSHSRQNSTARTIIDAAETTTTCPSYDFTTSGDVTVMAAARARKSRALRVRRPARTLGLIIGGFVVCWLPFFVETFIFFIHASFIIQSIMH
jgi:5-hydroxytryptamine receptor 1